MKLRKLSIIFLLFFTFGLSELKAQNNPYFIPSIFPKAPNSAALGKYGDYPVSMFSGLPTISIPLYEVQSGDLKVPITLDYHASGIKVDEAASWAGLGWVTSAGGEIDRRINGKADEGSTGYLSGNLRQTSSISTTNYTDLSYLNDVKNGQTDAQPDIFSYSFPGKSGKFFFDGTKAGYPIRLIPFAPVKISTSSLQYLTSFTIADEQGNAYQFGTRETSDFHPANGSSPQVSAWMLDKMFSQNRRDTIAFSYTAESVGLALGGTEILTVSDISSNLTGSQVYQSNPGTTSVSTNNSTTLEQKLNTIVFKNGKVVFNLSTANRQDIACKSLDNIQVFNYDYTQKQYQLLKTIRFYQSYFTDGTSNYPPRLRLDSIGIFESGGVQVQRYAFQYNSQLLPGVNTKGKDYWGYYNGKDSQTSLIPQMTIDYQPNEPGGSNTLTIGSNIANGRDPDGNYMQACMLQRIYYPTGGFTDFQYQPNQYIKDNVLTLAGGLRIANIKTYDGVNPVPIIKSYQYANARPNFFLNNYFFYTTQTGRYWGTASSFTIGVLGTQRRRTFVPSPSSDIESWDAVPVAYSTVTEYTGNGTSNLGKTVYRFNDYSDAIATASVAGKPFVNSFFFYRGQLQSKSVYALNADGSYRIVQREQMGYTAFPLTWYNGVGLAVGKSIINEGVKGPDGLIEPTENVSVHDDASFQFSNYDIPSDDNYLTNKTTTTYSADTTKYTVTNELYKYDNITHQQPSRIYHTDSKGNTVVNTMKYPADYLPVNGTTTGNVLLDSMINRNMQAELVEKWDSVKYISPVSQAVTAAQFNNFKPGSYNAILPDKISKLSIAVPVTNFVPARVISGQLQADSRYDQVISFDQYEALTNNLLQYTPRNGAPVSFIWDYTKALPIAQVKNATKDAIAYTSFEADGKGNWAFSGLPAPNAYAPAGGMVYPLTLGSVTSPVLPGSKAYTLSYWSSGAAATVTGIGATASSGSALRSTNGWTYYEHQLPVGTTGLSVSGSVNIDELRLYPANAQMTTNTYYPLIGTSSSADVNSLQTYYEYDNFQRLLNIKDLYKNITKTFTYRYSPYISGNQPMIMYYFNSAASGSFSKSDCGANATGSNVVYTVPENKYSSTVSQNAADQQAQNDIITNGPGYANSHGTCNLNYLNVAAQRTFNKSNCGVGYTGSTYTYTVNAGTYTSTISQADADQKAQNDINANGQTAANNAGTCPNGTDKANWTIVSAINSNDPTGHALIVTVTRPQGDVNNINPVTFHITTSNQGNLPGSFVMPAGVSSYIYNASFSFSLSGIITGDYLDTIN